MLRGLLIAGVMACLSACATTVPVPPVIEPPIVTEEVPQEPVTEAPKDIVIAEPVQQPEPGPAVTAPPPPIDLPLEVEIFETSKWLSLIHI